VNRDGQVLIRMQESCGTRHDAVSIGVGIVGDDDAEPLFEARKPRHRVRTRRVRSDFAVVIHRHERKRRVDDGIRDRDGDIVRDARRGRG